MTLKDWLGWIGPFIVAATTAILGPTLVEKIKARNAKPAPLTPEQEHDEDEEKRFERLRKDVDDLTAKNLALQTELDKCYKFRQDWWDHYDECPDLRKTHALKIKTKAS